MSLSKSSFLLKLAALKYISLRDWISLGLSVSGLAAISVGLVALLMSPTLPITEIAGVQAETPRLGELTVSVTGAVARPGLYGLQQGDRVAQALAVAGGVLPTADQEKLVGLNLAKPVTDGQQIYIAALEPEAPKTKSVSETTPTSGLININSASSTQLQSLPGIGEARAGKIIELRPYTSPQELVDKEAITQSIFDKLQSLITL